MANQPDDDLITLTCDHCGEDTQARVLTLRHNRTVSCLSCGVSLDYNPAKFKQDIEPGA